MEIEPTGTTSAATDQTEPTETPAPVAPMDDNEEEEEEDISDLLSLFESTTEPSVDSTAKISTLTSILTEPRSRFGPKATTLKERAIYSLARTRCAAPDRNDAVVSLLTGETCEPFFSNVTKAKCAKVVRAVLDIVCSAESDLETRAAICRNVLEWCREEKRTFLRQPVEARLASILFERKEYAEALELIDGLLVELKKLDDKQLLVETHLVECKIHHGLRGVAKAKAALTASRTCANAIYVTPLVQANIDEMSGVLHCEEGDYNTAHSYFLEAFEQLDQMDSQREKAGVGVGVEGGNGVRESRALPCLKYMMLCKILDAVVKALKLSSKGGVGAKSDKSEVDISNMISSRQAIKYEGQDIKAMTAIATAASSRSLKQYESTIETYSHELSEDLLIQHHLKFLHEQLLESNLIRIVEPYSCVEIGHIAKLIEMDAGVVEKKLSQMILDKKLNGILDQGKGHLVVYEEGEKDLAMEKGLEVIENMDNVVSSLFKRSRALRTMVA